MDTVLKWQSQDDYVQVANCYLLEGLYPKNSIISHGWALWVSSWMESCTGAALISRKGSSMFLTVQEKS